MALQHVGYERHDDGVENRFELQRHHRVRMRNVGGGILRHWYLGSRQSDAGISSCVCDTGDDLGG